MSYKHERFSRIDSTVIEIARRSLKIPDDESLSLVRERLLADRESTDLIDQQEGLNYLLEWALPIASLNAGLENIVKSPYISLPRVNSVALVEAGVITDEKTKRQVELRTKMRQARERGPAENGLNLRILDQVEAADFLQESDLQDIELALEITESFTVTSLEYPKIEWNVYSRFVIGKDKNRQIHLFFVDETHEVHGHVFIGGRWVKITPERNPDFKIPDDIDSPDLREGFGRATNEDVAALLVLFREAVK